MDLFERFEQLTAHINQLNRQATNDPSIPYIRQQEYYHYCGMKMLFQNYSCRLRIPEAEKQALFRFCYEDTLFLRGRLGAFDLHIFSFHYLKGMTYRTGNLDTPDDCVEKLDLDLLYAYRAAREKQWKKKPLTEKEQDLLEFVVQKALKAMRT